MRTGNWTIVLACMGLMACGDPAPLSSGGRGNQNNTGGGGGDGDQNDDDDDDYRGGDGDDWSGNDDNVDDDGDGHCQAQVIRNDRIPPDMLIVLDRSGSMKMNNTNRWDPSVNALKQVTADLGGTIDFGLMTFPHGGNQCGVGAVDVPMGPNTSGAISGALDAISPNGGTPTSQSLAKAHEILGPVSADPDAQVKPKYVLLVTDGEPNCLNVGTQCPSPFQDPFGWLSCQSQSDPGAITATVDAIKKMTDDGIKTYVVGYDTGSGSIKNTMDMMAQAGGTGATSHIVVKSGDELTKALQEIAGKAASCTLSLEKAVDDPSYVLVTIDKDTDNPVRLILNQPDGNGFSVAEDKRTVTIEGTSCDLLRSGGDHKLYVDVLCDPPIL